MRLGWSWFLLPFLLWGCFRSPEKSASPPVAAAPPSPPVEKKTKTTSRDADLLRIVKLAVQADQVQREAWWVVSNERRPAPKSAFGKLSRAALWALDGRLTTKGIFSCENYHVLKEKSSAPGRWQGSFSEQCGKSGEKLLAVWRDTGANSAHVEFSPSHLGEVLGIGASIFGKPLVCEISWSDSGLLSVLSCPRWEQDRGSQLVRLDVYEYRRDEGNLLKLKGQVLENLLPVRKIEASVPLEGKITVVETELNPPEPEPAKAPTPPKPVAPKTPLPGGATVENEPAPGASTPAPVDPDLLLKRQSVRVRPGSEAEPDGPQIEVAPAPPGPPAPEGEMLENQMMPPEPGTVFSAPATPGAPVPEGPTEPQRNSEPELIPDDALSNR